MREHHELLRQIRYERTKIAEQLGRHAFARRDLERIYAEAPNLEDAADRLGLASGKRSPERIPTRVPAVPD